jgi:hypothetical protein
MSLKCLSIDILGEDVRIILDAWYMFNHHQALLLQLSKIKESNINMSGSATDTVVVR